LIELKVKIRITTLVFSILVLLSAIALVFAVPYTITPENPINGSSLSSSTVWFNFTTNDTLISSSGGCYLKFPSTNTTNQTMTNDTTTHCYWSRAVPDSAYGEWHNVTFYVNDTLGIGNISSSSVVYFKVDTIDPSISWWNFTQTNDSSAGYIEVKFNVTDNNTQVCGVFIQQEDGTQTWKAGTLSASAQSRNCTVNITSSDITQDGDFIIYHWANDTAGNSANATTTETGVLTSLKSGKWNLVTFTGDQGNTTSGGINTLAPDILNNLPGCTHISRWNNNYGWKNYTTYAISTPSVNNDTLIQLGNATWIYCSSDDYYFRKNYLSSIQGTADENITLYVNASAADTKWNLVGLLVDKTLNQTLYPGGVLVGHQANITAVSWYNSTLGHYITCVKEFGGALCTAGYNATEITVTKASAVWMHVNANVTINRTGM